MWADQDNSEGIEQGLLVYLRQRVFLPGYPETEVESLL